MRPTYCHPLDVYQVFNPQTDEAALNNNDPIGTSDDFELLVSHIEIAEGQWDRHAMPLREVRIGASPGYVYKSAKGRGWPVHVYLDHRNIIPFDSAQGDEISRRNGRDSWTDITSDEGSAWTADYTEGVLTVYRRAGGGQLPALLHDFRDRFIRVTYRLGIGGQYSRAGQTTLSEQLSGSSTGSFNVADASRLPPGGGTMFVGGAEYIEVSSVDHSADTITVATRGVRLTDGGTSHSSGTTIHYCPLDVRGAVAKKAAQELVRHNDWTDQLVEVTGNATPPSERKLNDWGESFRQTARAYSDNYGYQ